MKKAFVFGLFLLCAAFAQQAYAADQCVVDLGSNGGKGGLLNSRTNSDQTSTSGVAHDTDMGGVLNNNVVDQNTASDSDQDDAFEAPAQGGVAGSVFAGPAASEEGPSGLTYAFADLSTAIMLSWWVWLLFVIAALIVTAMYIRTLLASQELQNS